MAGMAGRIVARQQPQAEQRYVIVGGGEEFTQYPAPSLVSASEFKEELRRVRDHIDTVKKALEDIKEKVIENQVELRHVADSKQIEQTKGEMRDYIDGQLKDRTKLYIAIVGLVATLVSAVVSLTVKLMQAGG